MDLQELFSTPPKPFPDSGWRGSYLPFILVPIGLRSFLFSFFCFLTALYPNCLTRYSSFLPPSQGTPPPLFSFNEERRSILTLSCVKLCL